MDDVPYLYDANGNLTVQDLGPYGYTLVYDAWNRMVALESSNGQTMAYDGLGRRITEIGIDKSAELYYSASGQILEEYTVYAVAEVDQTILRNVFSPVYVNAILMRDRDTNGDGVFDERLYFTTDANYNVTGEVDTSGQAVRRQVYSSYGIATFLKADWTPVDDASLYGVLELTHLYQGMPLDWETQWYYAGSSNDGRIYNPALAIWQRPDKFYIDSMNLYQFVAGNPINSVDPNGTITWVLNKGAKTLTMHVLVQTIFKKGDDGSTWTLVREMQFRQNLKSTIENQWNGTPFRLHPTYSALIVASGPHGVKKDVVNAPCAADGIAPKVFIDFTTIDTPSISEDWEVNVKSNPTGTYYRASNSGGWGWLSESSVLPFPLLGGIGTQITATHEFGHFLGLDHPGGRGNDPGNYTYVGRDSENHEVNGPSDLMGAGQQMRTFYYQKWANYMNGTYYYWNSIIPNANTFQYTVVDH